MVIGLPDEDLERLPRALLQVTSEVAARRAGANFYRSGLHRQAATIFERVHHELRDDAGKVRRSAATAERLGLTLCPGAQYIVTTQARQSEVVLQADPGAGNLTRASLAAKLPGQLGACAVR